MMAATGRVPDCPEQSRFGGRTLAVVGFVLVTVGLLVPSQLVFAQSELRFEHSLPLVMSASNPARMGFVRIVNHSDRDGTVQIHAIDDSGERFGPDTLELEARVSRHFNSGDLESGNAQKGLSGGVGDGEGDWRLELETTLDIEPLAYVRTDDGFVTAMHDHVAEGGSMRYHVPIFNPGGNRNQVSRLRFINPSGTGATVETTGVDDEGELPQSTVNLTVPPAGARTVTAQELESGASGLSGSFGDGDGKWHLFVTADRPIQVMNPLRSPTGHLTNLSTSTSEHDFDTPGFAPADQAAFDRLMVGRQLDAGTFVLEFMSGGRFVETARSYEVSGSYSYSNSGPNAGALSLTYDRNVFGRSCTVQLTYGSSTTGTWRYTCASGVQDQGNWHLTGMGFEFIDGESTTRTISENTPAGINAGAPVSARGGEGLTYSIGGTDAAPSAEMDEACSFLRSPRVESDSARR